MPEPEPSEVSSGKFAKFKSSFAKAFTKADDDTERFSSFDRHPFDGSEKRFSTLRSEFLHGKILKPIDNYLEKEDEGDAGDVGFFGSIWQFSDDEERLDDSE